jgi:hypothetical protein
MYLTLFVGVSKELSPSSRSVFSRMELNSGENKKSSKLVSHSRRHIYQVVVRSKTQSDHVHSLA